MLLPNYRTDNSFVCNLNIYKRFLNQENSTYNVLDSNFNELVFLRFRHGIFVRMLSQKADTGIDSKQKLPDFACADI
jgi:hypothetical protein